MTGPVVEGQVQVRKKYPGPGPDRTSDSLTMTTTTTTNHQPLAASTTRDAEVQFSLVLPEFCRMQNRTLRSVQEILPNVELDHRVQVQEGPVQVQQRFEHGTEHLYITRPGGAHGFAMAYANIGHSF